jgi:GNAT superfamily N-acetyltransferase
MATIIIREATAEDVEAMREIQRRTWLATYPNEAYGITREDIEARFREDPATASARQAQRRRAVLTPPHHAWVALEATEPIGFCIIEQGEHEHLVQALYVLPEHQGKGTGTRLLRAALDWLGSENPIALNVASYNERAIAFYQAFGFVLDGPVASEETLQLPSGVRFPEVRMVKRGQ